MCSGRRRAPPRGRLSSNFRVAGTGRQATAHQVAGLGVKMAFERMQVMNMNVHSCINCEYAVIEGFAGSGGQTT